MIEAYRSGIPDNGKPFPDRSKIAKIHWKPEKSAEAPGPTTVPGALQNVDFIEKDSKRFADSGGWGYAAFEYDTTTDTFRPANTSDAPPQENDAKCGFTCHTIVQAKDYLKTTRWREAASLAFLLVLPFSSIGWALATPASGGKAPDRRDACLATSAFADLARLPPGLVAGPIDAGSHILALTPHAVLAAPYHRDNHGNRIVLDALPDRAIPAKVSFVADVAQFTPKTVETQSERQKLMFRVKAQIDRKLLDRYITQVKTGLPGMAYVRIDPKSEWPAKLTVNVPQ